MIEFKAGAKALAEEVNSNFNEVIEAVDLVNNTLSSVDSTLRADMENKADKDGVNSDPLCAKNILNNGSIPYVESRTQTGGGVVEIWSDGYCVQTGATSAPSTTVQLSQAYKDTSGTLLVTTIRSFSASVGEGSPGGAWLSPNSIYVESNIIGAGAYWRTEGWIR